MSPTIDAPALDGWRPVYSGKVRDLYEPADADPGTGDEVLVVASDRISAFDYILDTLIPGKGEVLTQLTAWWFAALDQSDLGIPHHLLSMDDPRIPRSVLGRAMLCRRLTMVPIECVVRGYLTGSGLADYRATGAVCGIALPEGLRDGDLIVDADGAPMPIFTPARKADLGDHDENIDATEVARLVGADLAEQLRVSSVALYQWAEGIARTKGIILADTKFEFGFDAEGTLRLGDEVLTPDSSRFWAADQWRPGGAQPSFDKQFVRDWLKSPQANWQAGDPPALPGDVVTATANRYREALRLLAS